MDNNDLFIDTMDKINTLAKSRGFVNGNDWAKTAARKKVITEMQLSSFENLHSLRNLMAHGSAKDIVISPDTLSVALSFLTSLAGSNLTPAAKEQQPTAINWSDSSYLQPGDFVLFPYFQGFINVHNGAPKHGISIMDLYYQKLERSCYDDERTGFIFRVGEGAKMQASNVGVCSSFVPNGAELKRCRAFSKSFVSFSGSEGIIFMGSSESPNISSFLSVKKLMVICLVGRVWNLLL